MLHLHRDGIPDVANGGSSILASRNVSAVRMVSDASNVISVLDKVTLSVLGRVVNTAHACSEVGH